MNVFHFFKLLTYLDKKQLAQKELNIKYFKIMAI